MCTYQTQTTQGPKKREGKTIKCMQVFFLYSLIYKVLNFNSNYLESLCNLSHYKSGISKQFFLVKVHYWLEGHKKLQNIPIN